MNLFSISERLNIVCTTQFSQKHYEVCDEEYKTYLLLFSCQETDFLLVIRHFFEAFGKLSSHT